MRPSLSLLGVTLIFISSTWILYSLLKFAPDAIWHFPSSFDQVRQMSVILAEYRDDHYTYVVVVFSLAYLYKQTFAIPGSIFMNVLAGALFGRWWSLVLVCPLTAFGASFCFLISRHCAQPLVERYLGARLQNLRLSVNENRHRLFYFLLFARLFPISPNWLINICSPFVDIPINIFFLSVFIGLAPYNFVCIQAGCIITEVTSTQQIFNLSTMIQLFTIACIMLVFALASKRNVVQQ